VVAPSAGDVVLVPFPISGLSQTRSGRPFAWPTRFQSDGTIVRKQGIDIVAHRESNRDFT
jgi:hypothetical protein